MLAQAPRPDAPVRFTVGLALSGAARLEKQLLEASDPWDPNYGRYLSMQQAHALTPLRVPDAAARVEAWVRKAAGAGGSCVADSSAHGFVVVRCDVAGAARLFPGVTFAQFVSAHRPASTRTMVRAVVAGEAGEASFSTTSLLPAALRHVADFVSGVHALPSERLRLRHSSEYATTVRTGGGDNNDKNNNNDNLGTDPPSLRTSYNIGAATCTHRNTTQATANFLGEGYSEDDLRFFFEVFYNDGEGQTVAKVVGQNNDASLEASLDIQYILSIGQGATTWWISDDDTHDKQEPFLAWLVQMSNTSDTPVVHSVSYADLEPGVDRAYAQRCDLEFMKAGVRGISILVASGDDGAGCNSAKTSLVVEWPSSSPYITSVGATTIPASGKQVESAAAFSGGGFSRISPRPKYQDAAVKGFLVAAGAHLPAKGFFNASGRTVPDVSAMGTLFSVIVAQQPTVVAGTSAATPVWAGLTSLLNDARFNKGMPSMGFLNPWLYALPFGTLRDIADGVSTPGGSISDESCGKSKGGWHAVRGYDLATGLGVPDFKQLVHAALNVTEMLAASM
jgi:tripeptidyl-peptidase-1